MPAVPSCVLDPLREEFLALLPERIDRHPLGCHRPRIDDHVVFDKLVAGPVFGSATVVNLTLQQLQKTTNGQLAAAQDLQVTPPQCASALHSTQLDPNQVKDLVGQSATTQGGPGGEQTVTVEAIMTGDAANGAVDRLKSTLANCPKVTATSPQIGTATVQFTPLDVSGVGGQAAAASYTTTLSPPNHAPVAVPALLAVVHDGDRLLLLLTAAGSQANLTAGGPAPTAPDQHTFTTLLQKAYTTEHQALG